MRAGGGGQRIIFLLLLNKVRIGSLGTWRGSSSSQWGMAGLGALWYAPITVFIPSLPHKDP